MYDVKDIDRFNILPPCHFLLIQYLRPPCFGLNLLKVDHMTAADRKL